MQNFQQLSESARLLAALQPSLDVVLTGQGENKQADSELQLHSAAVILLVKLSDWCYYSVLLG